MFSERSKEKQPAKLTDTLEKSISIQNKMKQCNIHELMAWSYIKKQFFNNTGRYDYL